MDTVERLGETLAVLHREGPQQPLERFHGWAFEVVKTLIDFDGASWAVGEWVANGEPVTRNVYTYRLPAMMASDWEAMRTDTGRQAALKKMIDAAGSSVVFGRDELRTDPLSVKYDIAAVAGSCVLNPATRLLDVVCFYKFAEGAPFDERERRLHQAVVPHLLDLERKIWLRRLGELNTPCDMGAADNQAVCDGEGVLRLTQSGFVRALLAEWPSWEGPVVPEALLDVLRQGQDTEIAGERAMISIVRHFDLFVLTARKRAAIDALSPREQIVAQKWARGCSYKEIAAEIEISPATVRNHVARIYDKLAVSGRPQLATALDERT